MSDDIDDLKYMRTGYLKQSRKSDLLLETALEVIPGDGVLPKYWVYKDVDSFLKKHGHLGKVLWASASSSHLLLINGYPVLRIWTDAVKSCQIDMLDHIAETVSKETWGKIEDIPEGNRKKCQPFTKRMKATQNFQVKGILEIAKRIYGLDLPRLSMFER